MNIIHVVTNLTFWVIIRSCSCRTNDYFDRLSFTPNKCNTEPIKVGRYRKYVLTWNGQMQPRLCRLSFSSQMSNYEVCFKSTVYNLPYKYGNIKLNVNNHTKTVWVFDKDSTRIDYTCVSRAHKMVVSLEIPPGYIEPAPMTYLQMEFTAEIIPGKVTKPKVSFGSILFPAISVVVFSCFIYVCVRSNSRLSLGDLCDNFSKCCPRCLCYYITCECFDHCSCLSCGCDFNCNDICLNCNERCLNFLIQNRDEETNNQTNVQRTELDAINEISENDIMPLEEGGLTEPPPSYQAVAAICWYEDPTSPPPSYEDVTNQSASARTKSV